MGRALVLALALLVGLPQTIRVPFTAPQPSGDKVLLDATTAISHVCTFKMPSSMDGASTFASYGMMGGYKVGGTIHLLLTTSSVGYTDGNFGSIGYTKGVIASGTSTTVFTMTSGHTAGFVSGGTINVVRAANGASLPENRTITDITGDQITVTPALGGTPASSDVAYTEYSTDGLVDITPPTSGCTTDWTTTSRATFNHWWRDIYRGHRVAWLSGTLHAPISNGIVPTSFYVDDSTSPPTVWTGFRDIYNVTLNPNQSLVCFTLDDMATNAITVGGPFKFTVTDGDGTTRAGGSGKALIFQKNPEDGKLLASGWPMGTHEGSFGFSLYGGTSFPSCASTTSATSAIALAKRFADGYYMADSLSSNYIDADGDVVGTLRSGRRRFQPYIFERYADLPHPIAQQSVDPSLFGGVGSWTELDVVNGWQWLNLTNHRGVLVVANLHGSPDQDPNSSDAAHGFYFNAALGNSACTHGITPASATTGPVSTHRFPMLGVVDPTKLNEVAAGSRTDYTIEPDSAIDLLTLGLKTAPQELNGANVDVSPGYFDPTTNDYYLLSRMGEATSGTPAGNEQALVHVIHIDDSLPPMPAPAPDPTRPIGALLLTLGLGSAWAFRRWA